MMHGFEKKNSPTIVIRGSVSGKLTESLAVAKSDAYDAMRS